MKLSLKELHLLNKQREEVTLRWERARAFMFDENDFNGKWFTYSNQQYKNIQNVLRSSK